MKMLLLAWPRFKLQLILVALAVPLGTALGQGQPMVREQIDALLKTQSPAATMIRVNALEEAHAAVRADGFVRFLTAGRGHHFTVPGKSPGRPEVTAHNFLTTNGKLFGVNSPAVDFTPIKTKTRGGRRAVRFQQTYAGIPIFGAEANVQVNLEDGVESVLSTAATDTVDLDNKRVSTAPALTALEAANKGRELYAAKAGGEQLTISSPVLQVFVPSVVDASGPTRLVWEMKITTPSAMYVAEEILIDANSGGLVRRYPLNIPILARSVFDCHNSGIIPPVPARIEGQGANSQGEVNDSYDALGDTYAFYHDRHGRDSIDASGEPMVANARFCQPNAPTLENPFPAPTCPPPGLAYWSDTFQAMFIGDGYAKDDVVAHELTHGVTAHESGLKYENASGAINESFSDVWGEFVDLVNGRGNDSPGVRWDIGEEIPGGRIRSMSNPPAKGNPDRMGSALFTAYVNNPDQDANDYGGVHGNSGVNNKLCFLLTDGSTFNGYTITGMGIDRVADLYYEVNTQILLSTANYRDLYYALRQAANNLGWNDAERANLERACLAVEIGGFYVNPSNSCGSPDGTRRCDLGRGGPFRFFKDSVAVAAAGDTIVVQAGSYNESVRINKNVRIKPENGSVRIGR